MQIARTTNQAIPHGLRAFPVIQRVDQDTVRERRSSRIVSDLADDWQKHGSRAVARLRETDVAAYVRICVSLVPKELQLNSRPLSGLTEDELSALAQAARNPIAQGRCSSSRTRQLRKFQLMWSGGRFFLAHAQSDLGDRAAAAMQSVLYL